MTNSFSSENSVMSRTWPRWSPAHRLTLLYSSMRLPSSHTCHTRANPAWAYLSRCSKHQLSKDSISQMKMCSPFSAIAFVKRSHWPLTFFWTKHTFWTNFSATTHKHWIFTVGSCCKFAVCHTWVPTKSNLYSPQYSRNNTVYSLSLYLAFLTETACVYRVIWDC